MPEEERTQEHRDAEDALNDAIARFYRACGGTFLPTQWAVAVAVHGADDESVFDNVELLVQPNTPRHHTIGLLRSAAVMVENDPGEEIDT